MTLYSQRWRSGGQGRDPSIQTHQGFRVQRTHGRQYLVRNVCHCGPFRVAQGGCTEGGCDAHLTARSPCPNTSTAESIEYECIRRRKRFSRTSPDVPSAIFAICRHLTRTSEISRRTPRCAFPARSTAKERGAMGGWGASETTNWRSWCAEVNLRCV